MLRIVQNPECFEAVAKHREPIIDCLSEPDITLRKRALVLIFALINKHNVTNLVRELLQYLELADLEYRSYMVTELYAVAIQHAPDRKWHVDTLLSIVRRAPAHIPEELTRSFVQIFADSPDHHGYIAQTCYMMLKEQQHDAALCQICSWCLGEFGDCLFTGSQTEEPFTGNSTEMLDLLNKASLFVPFVCSIRFLFIYLFLF
jgi:AP-1 complex subunit gamma-1